jgi:hypothetical protein
MNSGAEGAKQVTGYEGIIPAPAEGKVSKKPSKEEVLQRYVDETPAAAAAAAPASAPKPARKKRVKKSMAALTPIASRPESTVPRGKRGEGSTDPSMGNLSTGGYRAKTKDVSMPLLEMHQHVSNAINSLRSVKSLSPSDHKVLDDASHHLMNSALAYHHAVKDGGLHTRFPNHDVAHGHLQDAVKHFALAHETLVQSGIHNLAAAHNIAAPLPHDDAVTELSTRSMTLERRGVMGVAGATKPFKSIPLGRGTVDPREYTREHVDDLARTFGKSHPGIEKLYTALGTRRGEGSELIGRSAVGSEGRGNRAGVVRPGRVDPRFRGSGRTINTRFSTDANPSRNTPTFGESGGSGTRDGDIQSPGTRKEGRGFRGGAV